MTRVFDRVIAEAFESDTDINPTTAVTTAVRHGTCFASYRRGGLS
jgi:hypothetical protein